MIKVVNETNGNEAKELKREFRVMLWGISGAISLRILLARKGIYAARGVIKLVEEQLEQGKTYDLYW